MHKVEEIDENGEMWIVVDVHNVDTAKIAVLQYFKDIYEGESSKIFASMTNFVLACNGYSGTWYFEEDGQLVTKMTDTTDSVEGTIIAQHSPL